MYLVQIGHPFQTPDRKDGGLAARITSLRVELEATAQIPTGLKIRVTRVERALSTLATGLGFRVKGFKV